MSKGKRAKSGSAHDIHKWENGLIQASLNEVILWNRSMKFDFLNLYILYKKLTNYYYNAVCFRLIDQSLSP